MGEVLIKRALTEEEMAGLRALRLEVFVGEQGVPRELELDALDAIAVHAIAVDGSEVVGTGRLVLLAPGEARVGRMAVRRPLRRRGIGAALLRFLEAEARTIGVRRIELHAQSYVRDFYLRQGYEPEGPPFAEAGIEHVLMGKALP